MAGPSKAWPSHVANTFVADLNFYACFLIASNSIEAHKAHEALKHGSLTSANTPQ